MGNNVTIRGIFEDLRAKGFTDTEIINEGFRLFEAIDEVNHAREFLRRNGLKGSIASLVLTVLLDVALEVGKFEQLFEGKQITKSVRSELYRLTDLLLKKFAFINKAIQKFDVEDFQRFEKLESKLANKKLSSSEAFELFLTLTYPQKKFSKVARQLKEKGLNESEILETVAILVDDMFNVQS